ncbi:MAG TPA: PepSY domain-containing protein [Methylophilus sp.]|nr:PepSY domain-containing protein [Methylophilus sp.]
MSIRKWYLIHKWTSLICTAFLLMLCITGLPLIFHEEIEHLVGVVEAPPMPENTPNISLDKVAEAARKQRPEDVIRFMFWEQDEHPNVTLVSMAKTMDASPDDSNIVLIDTRTAKVLDAPPPDRGFMYVMLKLHVDMFAGMPGMLFLGFMGLLFVAAIVSGVVLYHPFMRRLDFGTIRREKQARLKWLDIHNLLGVATLIWALVVGVTGTINTLSQIVIFVWQSDQMAEMIAPYKGLPPPTQLGSLQDSVETAKKAVPDMHVSFVAFPGSMFSSPHHYTVFMKGNTPVTSRLLRPALVDAQTAKLTDTREMPWYVKTLLLSQPLHFGDYGGLPLKVLWTLLDLVTIVVLVSGLYLWFKRRQHTEQRIRELEQKHAQAI